MNSKGLKGCMLMVRSQSHQITWIELKGWQEDGHFFVLVDVREAYERAKAHIGGLWIPLSEVRNRSEEWVSEVPVVFYCKRGIRSLLVVQRLQSLFPDVVMYSLKGGMDNLPGDYPVEK